VFRGHAPLTFRFRSGWLSLILASLSLTLLYLILFLVTGIGPNYAVPIAFLLGGQVLLGASVLAGVTRRLRLSQTFVGFSILTGATLFVAIGLITRGWGLDPGLFFWAFMALAFTAPFLANNRLPRRNADNVSNSTISRSRELVILIAPMALGLLSFVPFWRANPIKIQGWTALYGDIFYHETLSNSLARGSTMNLAALDQVIQYHWLGDAWSGLVTSVLELPPFMVLTRVLLIWSLVASVFLAAALGKHIQGGVLGSLFSSTYLAIAAPVGAGIAMTYTFILSEWSPTHSFAVPFAIALTLLVFRFLSPSSSLKSQNRFTIPLGVIVLAAVLTLSRVPFMLVILLSTLGLMVLSLRNQKQLARILKLLSLLSFGAFISWVAFIRGGRECAENGVSGLIASTSGGKVR